MRAIQVCNAVFAMGRLNLYNAELMDALLQVRVHAAVAAEAAMTVLDSSGSIRSGGNHRSSSRTSCSSSCSCCCYTSTGSGIGMTGLLLSACCAAQSHGSKFRVSQHSSTFCADICNVVYPTTCLKTTRVLFMPGSTALPPPAVRLAADDQLQCPAVCQVPEWPGCPQPGPICRHPGGAAGHTDSTAHCWLCTEGEQAVPQTLCADSKAPVGTLASCLGENKRHVNT